MKQYHALRRRLILTAALLCLAVPSQVLAQDGAGNPLAGRIFKAFIYGTELEKASMTITFKDNGSFLIDIYDGFGLYAAVGSAFAGIYSAPNHNKTDNLFMVLTGAVITDFLAGTGAVLYNFEYSGTVVFFGYAQN